MVQVVVVVHFGVAERDGICTIGDMLAADRRGLQRGGTMEITENPAITYPDAHLYCDRNGVLRMGTHVPDLMLPIAQAPWLRLSLAATGLALRSPGGDEWIVPGIARAGKNADAAMDAIWAVKRHREPIQGRH